jgi:tRNA dimethylallyltransferase
MQVYREIPTITNQARNRPAELVGIASVTEEWTVARHAESARDIIERAGRRFVLDAGTGMYLNAIILAIPLAPRVSLELRRVAQKMAEGATNPRRAARAAELELAGVPERASIWDGELRYETRLVYLRPRREALDSSIARRSRKISHEGVAEAARLLQMVQSGAAAINASVLESIGVRELVRYLHAEMTLEEAEAEISARTRKLARRQMRWFDKLARTLQGRASVDVVETPAHVSLSHYMHDRIGT